jgi:radical SAM protein with 4Fe4S-binding SPASM domain
MTEEDYKSRTGFCPAPWTSIYMQPNGDVDNCCISSNKLGNINKDSFEEIINSDNNISVKRQMLSNDVLPEGCSLCAGETPLPLRENYVKWFEKNPKTLFDSYNGFDLKYLDLRWRNTCNFACVYCSTDLSSAWAQELGIFPTKIDSTKFNEFHEYVLQNVKGLETVYLAGGEPLLIKENESILEQLYKENPKCKLRVNTNLSTINNRIYELISKFENVHWMVSAEATEDQYDYIRYGGKWTEFVANLKELQKNSRHEITFNAVYLSLNILGVFKFVDFVESQGIDPVKVSILYYNSGTGGSYDPRNLPPDVVEKAKQVIRQRLTTTTQSFTINKLQSILRLLDTPYDNKGYWGLYDMIKILDSRRNLDSFKTFPEIYS